MTSGPETTPWPRRRVMPHGRRRARDMSHDARRRLPVSAQGPKVAPRPTLRPKSRKDALATASIIGFIILLALTVFSYSMTRFEEVAIAGKIFTITVAVLSLIATALFTVSLGLYVLPVLFRVRRPAVDPPPRWPGVQQP